MHDAYSNIALNSIGYNGTSLGEWKHIVTSMHDAFKLYTISGTTNVQYIVPGAVKILFATAIHMGTDASCNIIIDSSKSDFKNGCVQFKTNHTNVTISIDIFIIYTEKKHNLLLPPLLFKFLKGVIYA